MPNLGAPELLIIAALIMLFFGAAKLPNVARSVGRSMRILKEETRELHDSDDHDRRG